MDRMQIEQQGMLRSLEEANTVKDAMTDAVQSLQDELQSVQGNVRDASTRQEATSARAERQQVSSSCCLLKGWGTLVDCLG